MRCYYVIHSAALRQLGHQQLFNLFIVIMFFPQSTTFTRCAAIGQEACPGGPRIPKDVIMCLCYLFIHFLFVYLYIYIFIYLSNHSFIHLFIYLFMYSFMYLFIYVFIYIFIYYLGLFINLFIYLFVYLFIYLFKGEVQ